jgi:hypothetical protein
MFLLSMMAVVAASNTTIVRDPSPARDSHIAGTLASVWMLPSGVQGKARFWDNGGGPFWNNTLLWAAWVSQRETDVALLRYSLGDSHSRHSAIVNFELYLADTDIWGGVPLQRLGQVCTHFLANGVRPILLLGKPEMSVM